MSQYVWEGQIHDLWKDKRKANNKIIKSNKTKNNNKICKTN